MRCVCCDIDEFFSGVILIDYVLQTVVLQEPRMVEVGEAAQDYSVLPVYIT